MKKPIITFLLTCLFSSAVLASSFIIEINGNVADLSQYGDAAPYIDSDRVMLPLRAVTEVLGGKVEWIPESKTVTVNKSDKADDNTAADFSISIGKEFAFIRGEKISTDIPAKIKEERTYIPLYLAAKALDVNVKWDAETKTVKIFTDETAEELTSVKAEADSEIPEEYFATVYLGITNYGQNSKDNLPSIGHKFFINGEKKVFKISSDESYTLQNRLAEGYVYNIKLENGIITEIGRSVASETAEAPDLENMSIYAVQRRPGGTSVTKVKHAPEETATVFSDNIAYLLPKSDIPTIPVSGTPGLKTVKNVLSTALTPVGHTLYMYGGAWNWQDNGASNDARSIGLPQNWVDFFDEHDATYTYRTEDAKSTYYPHNEFNQYYYAGADCSGYIGWVVYNVINTQSENTGYVTSSTKLAKSLESYGYGTWTQNVSLADFKPGDIMSINGHVWMFLGKCDDGSAVILHSTPSDSTLGYPGGGVQLSALGSTSSQAYALASRYMKTYYPEWSERYNAVAKSPASFLSFTGNDAGRFTWHSDGSCLTDPDGYLNMNAEQILKDLFGE